MQKRMLTAAAGLVMMLLLAACNGGVGPTSPATLTVTPEALDFGSAATELFLLVGNAGQEELEWSIAVEGDGDWLSVTPSSGVNGATVTVRAARDGLSAGEHSASLRIASNGGEATVPVALRVLDEEVDDPTPPSTSPGQVLNLDVRGVTVPTGMLESGGLHGIGAQELRSAVARADALFGDAGVALVGPSASVAPASLPSGYEAVFLLSWDEVPGATGYRLFRQEGGSYSPAGEVSVGALEDAGEPTYVFRGSFNPGDREVFRVQAFNEAGAGEPSEANGGVVIGPQTLSSPGDGTRASSTPTFTWSRHGEATGYILTVAQEERSGHVWQQVLAGGDETQRKYPGDDGNFGPELPAGEYLWYVVTQGPAPEGKAEAYAFSRDWTFEVK